MLALLERGVLDKIPGVGGVPRGVVNAGAGSVEVLSKLGLGKGQHFEKGDGEAVAVNSVVQL